MAAVLGRIQTPVLAVAGFIATTEQWIHFERNWREVCDRFGVSGLHIKDFAHSKREFESWKGEIKKRDRFMERLVNVIRTRVRHSFASVVVLKDYAALGGKFQGVEMNPYPLAGCTCITKVKGWAKRQNVDESTIAYVFEDGDGDQVEFFKHARFFFTVNPMFLPKKDSVAFQAADLLAYQYLKANKKICEFPPKTFSDGDLRICFQELLKIPNDFGIHDHDSLTRDLETDV